MNIPSDLIYWFVFGIIILISTIFKSDGWFSYLEREVRFENSQTNTQFNNWPVAALVWTLLPVTFCVLLGLVWNGSSHNQSEEIAAAAPAETTARVHAHHHQTPPAPHKHKHHK
jgi:hypothetical protein